jgi:hypothetical protein
VTLLEQLIDLQPRLGEHTGAVAGQFLVSMTDLLPKAVFVESRAAYRHERFHCGTASGRMGSVSTMGSYARIGIASGRRFGRCCEVR